MSQLMQRLQNLKTDRMDLDEAIELSIAAEQLREGYKKHQVPSPEIIDDSIRMLDRFIQDQSRDRAEMELRELMQADSADRTQSERRDARAKRREELEKKLGKAPAAV